MQLSSGELTTMSARASEKNRKREKKDIESGKKEYRKREKKKWMAKMENRHVHIKPKANMQTSRAIRLRCK